MTTNCSTLPREPFLLTSARVSGTLTSSTSMGTIFLFIFLVARKREIFLGLSLFIIFFTCQHYDQVSSRFLCARWQKEIYLFNYAILLLLLLLKKDEPRVFTGNYNLLNAQESRYPDVLVIRTYSLSGRTRYPAVLVIRPYSLFVITRYPAVVWPFS